MQGIIDCTKSMVIRVKQQIADIDAMNAEARQEEGKGEGTADERMRTTMTLGKDTAYMPLLSVLHQYKKSRRTYTST
jgi:hypothetical protein